MKTCLKLVLTSLSIVACSSAAQAEAQQTMPVGNGIECEFTLPVVSENSMLGWTGDCVDGYAEGKGLLIHADGTVDDAIFEGGLPNGDWVERTALGDTFIGQYDKGQRHGFWRLEYANGNLSVGEYVEGNRHGRWTEHYQEAGFTSEGMYMSGAKHGRWLYEFHKDQESASREEITYAFGVRNGLVIIMRQQGREHIKGQYRDGQADGLWVVTIDRDLQREMRYKAGILHGKYRNYVDGDHSFWEEGFYDRGVKQGEWIERYNGQATGFYVDGRRQGEWKTHDVDYMHEGETVITTASGGPFVDGEQQGIWITTRNEKNYGTCRWSELRMVREPYENGRQHGTSLAYDVARSSRCPELRRAASCESQVWDQGVRGMSRSVSMRTCREALDIR